MWQSLWCHKMDYFSPPYMYLLKACHMLQDLKTGILPCWICIRNVAFSQRHSMCSKTSITAYSLVDNTDFKLCWKRVWGGCSYMPLIYTFRRYICKSICKQGLNHDLVITNMLIDVCKFWITWNCSSRLFDHVPDQLVVSWNALLTHYTEFNSCDQVFVMPTNFFIALGIRWEISW